MKCELAAALLHRPTTLFLDEPTIGLDVAMQVAIRDFVRSYNQRHEATVLLTSHYMDDVVALCPRIIVIDQGKLIHDGDLRELVKHDGSRQARVVHADRADRRRRAREARHACSRSDGQRITLRVAGARAPGVVGQLLGTLQVADLAIEDPPLEDVLREMFGKRSTEPTRRERRRAHAARAADAAAHRRRRDRRLPRRVPRLDPDHDACR